MNPPSENRAVSQNGGLLPTAMPYVVSDIKASCTVRFEIRPLVVEPTLTPEVSVREDLFIILIMLKHVLITVVCLKR